MQRSLALRPLSSEHHQALVLARRARRASEELSAPEARGVWDAVVAAFKNELVPHFALEENELLPALERAGGVRAAEAAERTRREHDAIGRLMAEAPGGDPRLLLAHFAALMEAHVRFEERELFPLAEQHLTEKELALVARATGP